MTDAFSRRETFGPAEGGVGRPAPSVAGCLADAAGQLPARRLVGFLDNSHKHRTAEGAILRTQTDVLGEPFKFEPVPKRDARFQDSYNGGVNPEAFLYDERFSPRDKVLMLFYKRLREIDVRR